WPRSSGSASSTTPSSPRTGARTPTGSGRTPAGRTPAGRSRRCSSATRRGTRTRPGTSPAPTTT
ncbi:MAG: hypothetical protein AVDCRST_MAG36-1342, partial [uncultured Nocardioidaceae bacterium]